jgi:hypothetical protein
VASKDCSTPSGLKPEAGSPKPESPESPDGLNPACDAVYSQEELTTEEDPMDFVRLSSARTTRSRPASALDLLARGWPLLLLTLLAVLPSPAFAADPLSRLMKGPVIRFDQRTVDFGRIPQHASRAQTFTLRNEGTEPLRILKVTPDCGCTVAEPADTVIAPGASTTLRVVFSSGEYEGDLRKVVILETNDPAEPRVDLLLLVHVAPEVQISERVLDFGPVRRGGTPVLTTILKAEPGVPFTVRTPVGAEELVEWKVVQDPPTGPGAWKVEARIRSDAPFGRFNVRVEIPYGHPNKKSDHISVRGFIHAYFRPVDAAINFGSLTAGGVLTRTLRLKADGPAEYLITAARPSAPYLTTSLKRDGDDYLLTVILAAKDPMRMRETVRLETTDPEQPELIIDVRGTVR